MDSSDSAPISDMSGSSLGNGRFSNRAARFYWADDDEPQRAFTAQQLTKVSTDSNFEESPLVIASISAGVIGVAIIIIILVGIWIRSRLFSEMEVRSGGGGSEHPNNASVRSSMSTLDEEEAYTTVCMEMDATVLGSMHNVADNCCANSPATIELENECETNDKSTVQPESPVPNSCSITNDCAAVIMTIEPDSSVKEDK